MRRGDDDLSPFRDDPVFQALTGPATPEELAGEAEAVAAFQANVTVLPRRRTAARVAASGTAAVVLVGLTGGVAAAYTARLPESTQQTLHDALGSIGIPAPHHHHKSAPAATPITSTVPTPVPVQSTAPAEPHASPSATIDVTSSPEPTVTPTSTLPVVLPTESVTPTPTDGVTPTPTPTPTHTGLFHGATLAIDASEAKVSLGGSVTVTGRLVTADMAPIADRKVGLHYRVAGIPGWSRLGPQLTSPDGVVTFTVSGIQHNVRILLHAGRHVHSAVTRVAVVPVITVRVNPVTAGATSTAVSITVAGALPGDAVVIRPRGVRHGGQQVALDSTESAIVAVPVSQTSATRYRVFIPRTKAHAAHGLDFYVPASGTT